MNLDQIGRLDPSGRFLAVGTGSAAAWPALHDHATAGLPLSWVAHADGYAPSDQAVLLARDVPVIHWFTGVRPQQHTPQDTVARLNPGGALALVRAAERLVTALATRPERLRLVPPGPRPGTDGPPYGSDSMRRGRGLVVSLEASGAGALVHAVLPRSPAAGAGVRVGDRILSFGGRPVRDAGAYADALKMTHATRPVEVQVRRGDEVLTIEVGVAKARER
jgi:hypothetical protein